MVRAAEGPPDKLKAKPYMGQFLQGGKNERTLTWVLDELERNQKKGKSSKNIFPR